jgi:hypothetical protein
VGRHAATCVLVVAAWTAVFAQLVPVSKEPHHRVVYEDANLRVLDVVIPPGVTTLEHSHDHDLITVSIGQADTRTRAPGEDWGPVRPRRPIGDTSTVEYAGKQGVHTIRNVGPDPYRLLAVENVRQSGWHTTAAALAPGVRIAAESRAFRAYAVTLGTGHRSVTRRPGVPAVVVIATGQAALTKNGRNPESLGPSARWAVVKAGEEYTVTASDGEARLVEIEVR